MKLALTVEMTEDGLKLLDSFVNYVKISGQKISELHLIHCFETKVYTSDFYVDVFPSKEQYPEIDEAVTKVLKNRGDELFKKIQKPEKVIYKCLHAANYKEAIVDYLAHHKLDMVAIPTRGLTGVKGLFSSSFADFLAHHSPCNVLVLRPIN